MLPSLCTSLRGLLSVFSEAHTIEVRTYTSQVGGSTGNGTVPHIVLDFQSSICSSVNQPRSLGVSMR